MRFDENTPVNPLSSRPLSPGPKSAQSTPSQALVDLSVLKALEQRKPSFARRVLGLVSQIHGRADDTHKAGGDNLRYPLKIANREGQLEPMPEAFLEMAALADGLGFRYVGSVREGVTPEGIHSDVFIAEGDSAFMLHAQRRSSDPLVRSHARYCLYTFFADGTVQETHSNADEPLKPSPFVAGVIGTGVLAHDWAAHQQNTAALAASRRVAVIRVDDHAAVLRLLRFYAGHVISEEHARTFFILVGVACAIIAACLFIVERLL